MRNRSVYNRARQFARAGAALEVLVSSIKTQADCKSILRFLKVLDKHAMRLQAFLQTHKTRVAPHRRLKKQPGEAQLWGSFETPYRCWACMYMGGPRCDNPFLNRKACSNFRFNLTLVKHPERIASMRKDKATQLDKLKLPYVKSFSEHIEKCKHCEKLTQRKKKQGLVINMSKHYQKYRSRRIQKVAARLAFYGITFRENYILPWEN